MPGHGTIILVMIDLFSNRKKTGATFSSGRRFFLIGTLVLRWEGFSLSHALGVSERSGALFFLFHL